MKRFAIAAVLFSACPLSATVIVVPINPSDTSIDGDYLEDPPTYNVAWNGGVNSRVGMSSAGLPYVYVMPFALPEIPAGEQIITATLTFNVEGWLSYAAIGDVQLFGINRVSNAATVVGASDFVDARNPSHNPLAVLLQADLVPSTVRVGSDVSGLTSPHTSTDFTPYIENLYSGSGGTAGQFGFLVMAVDISTVGSTANNFYKISSTDSGTAAWQPFLTIETVAVPEPATYGLILGSSLLGLVFWKRLRS